MNRRLAKEFRSLLLPWSLAALAASLLPLFLVLNSDAQHWYHDVWSFLEGCVAFSLCSSLALLAGMSFGTEYQQRTLPLLLAQPQERSRLWNEKMLVLVAAITSPLLLFGASLAAVACLWSGWNLHLKRDAEVVQVAIIAVILILTTVCSTGFWTMVTRSTIGGLAFSGSAQFLVGLGIGLTLQKIYGELPLPDSIATSTVVTVGLVYSAVFLWLSRRKFSTLELRDVSFGEGATSSTSPAASRWWLNWLRCRPHGSLRNLVRKELRLQKTVFMIAGVLLLGWLITLALAFLAPIRRDYLEGIFGGLTAGYMILLPVLAGGISLGEERTLGLTAWHLTLPISAGRQWLVKLIASAAVAGSLGLLLPILLLAFTAGAGKIEPLDFDALELATLLAAIGIPFLLSFWAVTLLGNTIRAILATVISLALLGNCAALGYWSATKLGGIEMPLFSWLIVHFELPPDFFIGDSAPRGVADRFWSNWESLLFSAFVAVGSLTALVQSLIQFRCDRPCKGAMLRSSLLLGVLTGCFSFWFADFSISANTFNYWPPTIELFQALHSLPSKDSDPTPGLARIVTLQELEQNGKLTLKTKTWLRSASISLVRIRPTQQASQSRKAIIVFPNGRHFSFMLNDQVPH